MSHVGALRPVIALSCPGEASFQKFRLEKENAHGLPFNREIPVRAQSVSIPFRALPNIAFTWFSPLTVPSVDGQIFQPMLRTRTLTWADTARQLPTCRHWSLSLSSSQGPQKTPADRLKSGNKKKEPGWEGKTALVLSRVKPAVSFSRSLISI